MKIFLGLFLGLVLSLCFLNRVLAAEYTILPLAEYTDQFPNLNSIKDINSRGQVLLSTEHNTLAIWDPVSGLKNWNQMGVEYLILDFFSSEKIVKADQLQFMAERLNDQGYILARCQGSFWLSLKGEYLHLNEVIVLAPFKDNYKIIDHLSLSAPMTSDEYFELNNHGDIVGTFQDYKGLIFPLAKWSDNQEIFILDRKASSFAINERGHIVGSLVSDKKKLFKSKHREHAFLWTPEAGGVDLGTLGGPSSRALDINEEGEIVGWSQVDTLTRGFLYHNGQMNDLGDIPQGILVESKALGINNNGQIVGYGITVDGKKRALIHDRQKGWQDLNELNDQAAEWELTEATANNDYGVIVGNGNWQGQSYAFLAIPLANVARK